MREAAVNGTSRSMADLRGKPPHGRQTTSALDLDGGGAERANAHGPDAATATQDHQMRDKQFPDDGSDYSYGGSNEDSNDTHPVANAKVHLGNSQDDARTTSLARPSNLARAKSDLGPRNRASKVESAAHDELAHIRHGWEDEYTSNEYLSLLHSAFYMYYTDKRHDTNGIPTTASQEWPSADWRMKDRLKTVSAALAICLNIGVDPPDAIKTNPTAKLEAWIDPTANSGGATKTMEQIGKRLQEQYETLSLRTRYKQYLDPSIDETKRFCISLRRNAKDERVLFHYNGHGVPLPTASGELWVFNKNYTQYIPVGIYDLQSWLAGPSLFVYDVSHAGNIVHNFATFIEKHEKENVEIRRKDPSAPIQHYSDCIQLAACGRTEKLPTNPSLPADLFTCCLTTPIDIALRFFVLQNPLPSNIPVDDNKIPVPGRLQDRRSPLGELNWIFTAITDTIAWNILSPALFKKLFRQDLMVAALFRNFLLSERIMRANHCHPISSPELPETHHHPLWQSWDLAIEMVLAQLPALMEHEEGKRVYEYQHSTFFAEQLTAFDLYLQSGPTEENAPDQLPIVLQVLLSQAHRLRALILLSKFLDLGPWAVHLALSIGIFPYVVKLLQAAASELKPVMVFIWARIMAVDDTVQSDLLKDNGIHYFITIMNPQSGEEDGVGEPEHLAEPDLVIPVGNASEHRAMCAFIIAIFCKKYPQGQNVCLSADLFDACLTNLTDPENPLLRQWSCLCLSMLWQDFSDAKWMGIRCGAHLRLCDLSLDPVPEVRAAMLHALTSFLVIPDLTDQVAQIEEGIAASVLFVITDGSTLVRKELLVFLSTFVKRYENKFTVCAYDQLAEEKHAVATAGQPGKNQDAAPASKLQSISQHTIFGVIWKQIMILATDPHPEVARNASIIVDYVYDALLNSPMAGLAQEIIADILRTSHRAPAPARRTPAPEVSHASDKAPRTPPVPMPKHESYLSLSLRKTASSLRNLAFGGSSSQELSDLPNSQSATKAEKPADPQLPTNTPRGRLPAEWSRPPETNDPSTSLRPHPQSVVPTAPGMSRQSPSPPPHIPLKSTLLEWATEYFREPQMKPNEPDEPGSADYNARLWRRSRNEQIIAENQPLKQQAGMSKWTHVRGLLNNHSQPTKLTFHQFDDHLAVADDKDTISIWDFQRNHQLSRFSNANPPGSKINDAKFLNEDDQPLLMVGSSDGVLKVYRNYDSNKRVRIVTAFRALSELIPSTRNAGLVFDWQQGQGKALVAGDVKVIKVWNVATEICAGDIPARSSSCVTSLTSDQVAGQIFIAGFGDGVVRVFDQRLNPRVSMTRVWREHKQWITGLHMQRGGVRELVSASRNGEVKLWDLRNEHASVASFGVVADDDHETTLRTLSVHEHAPVFAVGTDRNEVRSFNTDGLGLGTFEPARAGLGVGSVGSVVVGGGGGGGARRPVVATAYHPHRMLLAGAGLGDGHVCLMGY